MSYSVATRPAPGVSSPISTETVSPNKTINMTAGAGQTTTTENAGAITPEQGQPNPPDSSVLAQLAQREKSLRRAARQLRGEQQRIEAERQRLSAIEAENGRLKSWQSRLAQAPVEVLNEAGVSGDVITQGILNQPSPEIIALRAELTKAQQQLQQVQQQNQQVQETIKTAQQQQYEQAKRQMTNDTKMLVDGNDQFKTIAAMSAQDAVVELIEQTYYKQGYLMSVEQAAQEVEKYLVAEGVKIASLDPVQQALQAARTVPPAPGAGQRSPTLSNRMTTSAPRKFSEKERVQRAILAVQGKLTPGT